MDGIRDGDLVVSHVQVLKGLEITQRSGLDGLHTGKVEEERVEREAAPEGAVSQHFELVSAQVEALEVVEAREGLAVDRGNPVVAQIDLNGESFIEDRFQPKAGFKVTIHFSKDKSS